MKKNEHNKLRKLDVSAPPPTGRVKLKGQAEIALILHDRGYGPTSISRFLTTHGKPVTVAAISKFLKDQKHEHES